MKALFIHQNCPGQFRHLARHLAALPGHEVTFITRTGKPDLPNVKKVEYAPHRGLTEGIHPYLASSEAAVLHGQAVARVAFRMKDDGYRPDVIIGNPGWGETLYLKDVWPDTPLILLAEFFYRNRGADVGFDPEFDGGRDARLRTRTRSGPHLMAIDSADVAYAPTAWQRAQFPEAYQDKIRIIHDGIDCARVAPDDGATFPLSETRTLTRQDEVLTYVARNLEPYRGFHSFMRALPAILKARPEATVVIVGGDGISYGSRPPGGGTWRETLLNEVGPLPERVQFTGRLTYDDYLNLLRVSSAHLYLTYPFVLSWSMLEAMAAGCVVIGSRTPPVEEVIRDGINGRLVDFFDTDEIAGTTAEVLATRDALADMRAAGRETILETYDLAKCLDQQIALITAAVSSR